MKYRIIIIFAIITAFTFTSCNNENSEKEKEHTEKEHDEHEEEGTVSLSAEQQKALKLKIGTFQMRNLTTVVKVSGQLEVAPNKKAEITAIVGGNVKKINVFAGDKIYKGKILAVLEHPAYIKLQEDFAVTAGKLDFLEQEYKRQKELYEKNAGSGKDFQKAKSEFITAKAKYEGLKSRLQLLNISYERVINGKISSTINIISPISGYVNEINIKLGTFADDKTKMFEIIDNSAIHADFLVYEKDVHLVKNGQKLHFTVSNRTEEEYTATVFAIGKKFDTEARAVHIHTKITGDTKGLIPGMFATGHLHTDKILTKTLPDDAIVKEGAKSYIFIVDNDEHEEHNHEKEHENSEKTTFKMLEVITGQSDDGYTQVTLTEDLPTDTKIVLNSTYYLLADMKKEETEHEH